jgi:S1-C subfamily serine protease
MKMFSPNGIRTGKNALALAGMVGALLAASVPSFGATSLLSPEARRDLELQPGVVLIVVSFEATLGEFSCKASALGSGLLYRPDGYLITNGHVAQWANVKDNNAAAARMNQAIPCLAKEVLKGVQAKAGRQLTQEENDDVLGQVAQAIKAGRVRIGVPSLRVMLDNGSSYQGEIKAYSDPISEGGKDIAIIKVDGRNLPTVALGTSDGINVGDPITVVGYPGDAIISEHSILVPTVTNGRISAVNKQDYKGTPVLQSEATINHGNSGGPAFDASGRVVGIATYTAKEASGLNFFVPIDTALEFVRQAGAQPARGPFDQIWHDALEAYGNEKWSRAHSLMGNVLEMLPDQPDAKRLQTQAAQNIPSNPIMRFVDSAGLPAVLGGAAVILGILVALVAFTLVRRGTPASVKPVTTIAAQAPAPTVPAHSPSTAPVRQAASPTESFGSLQISNGPLAGNRFVIPKAGLMIGRDPSSCAVVLPSDAVSKQHVWVVPLDNGVAVIDRNSVNGTYVNSTDSPRINKVVLKDGDRIFVGRKSPTEIMYFSS